MSCYYVQCLDGPAEGFAYYVMIPPPSVIVLAPSPSNGRWFRVPEGSVPWPGECRYRAVGDLPSAVADVDTIVNYRLET